MGLRRIDEKMKIINIRGKSGAGKTTISYELAKELKGYVFVDIWKIKEMFEPLNLKNRKPQNKICKDAVFQIIKYTLKENLSNNFILQESRVSTIKKYLKNYLSNKDKIYSFYLDVDLENTLKRNITREKRTMSKKHFIEQAKNSFPKKDREDIIIDTGKKTKKQVVDVILREIGVKRSSKKIKIRKCI